MDKNVGTIDRALRLAGGLLLITLTLAGAIGAWGYIGIVPLLTGLFTYCPVYSLLGIRTCPSGAPKG
jgi:hypothetical protein